MYSAQNKMERILDFRSTPLMEWKNRYMLIKIGKTLFGPW
ncbi:unnamed protein product [Strongylus vulgaris]|uniref:Uncharacterized protein n=1 Tax=Strongylus vulgaris TaxID=40348 RepID=A0A3P7J2D9_STRVU|nr:unnamed protein product [Strongylus vulgaris]